MADTKQVRPFADWLQEQRGGITHAEMSDAFNALVEAVTSVGKGGTVTLTIKVKPAGKGSSMVTISDTIKLAVPEGERAETIWFVDSDGNVTRDNPMQERLPLREVSRKADPETGELKDAK